MMAKILNSVGLFCGCVVLIGVLFLVGCGDKRLPEKTKKIGFPYSIVVLEGCEYILTDPTDTNNTTKYSSITHKGNCKNPIHKQLDIDLIHQLTAYTIDHENRLRKLEPAEASLK